MAAVSPSRLFTNYPRYALWFLWILLLFQYAYQIDEDPLDTLLTAYKNRRDIGAITPQSFNFLNHHRHVRDCQPIIYGNTTYETFSDVSTEPKTEFKSFFQKVVSKEGANYVNGHIVKISNPFNSLSVLEPDEPGGCAKNVRSTVAATMKRANCRLAVNAGFFNTHSGSCLGNIVSNGKLVRDAKGIQNANFGVLKNGSLVVGYLSQRDVTPGNGGSDFYQLVTGVIWLLRNGRLYINESIKAECRDTEETGTLMKFTEVMSGRTAVGHDIYGRVVIVQVDGKTNYKGVNLYDFAKLLQSFGLVNAINLDGGGSATFVEDGILVNYPSDQCDGYLCARKVSTILCVHDKMCNPSDCNGHGDCDSDGQCVCHFPWTGPSCSRQGCTKISQDDTKLVNISLQSNSSMPSRNETTKEIIKRFLIKNYAWMDAVLVISLIVNLILLLITFCGQSSDKIFVPRRSTKSSQREDQMTLLSANDDDEI